MTCEEEKRMLCELSKLTVRELRSIAKAEGVCLGYAGATKAGVVNEIVSARRYRELLNSL